MYIPRQAEKILKTLLKGFPIVVLTGPRQSGKSTLARHLIKDKPYITLEDPDEEQFALHDPRGFLQQFPDGVVLDEVQRCPQLLSYLQGIVDSDGRTGLFLLTGSQQFGLLSNITQTLAGRAGIVELLPFSLQELKKVNLAPDNIENLLFNGLYPPLYDRQISPKLWYPNYIRTYLDRDVRQMINIHQLHTFQNFVSLCAGRIGQLLNLTSLANDCSISPNTAKSWLNVLEASYIIYLLRPHHKNFNKRLIKTPKLYFYDVGLASRLLGIEKREQLINHSARGSLFESWVVSELLKNRYNLGQPSNLFFWRDRTGNEVDVLLDYGTYLNPVEIKSGSTVNESFFKGLKYWLNLAEQESGSAYLIYAGYKSQNRNQIQVLPWNKISLLEAE